MKANLVMNYYKDKNPARAAEIDTCLVANCLNTEIDSIQILVNEMDKPALDSILDRIEITKANPIIQNKRPSFYDYFNTTREHPDAINIVANTDIILDSASLEKLKKWDWKNYCLALTRWDLVDENLRLNEAVHYDRPDSQDCWMLKGAFPILPDAGFTLGIGGCDNKIGYLLNEHYNVVNPSKEIKTYHYHLTNIRNYMDGKSQENLVRLNPPYHIMHPIPFDAL